MTAWANTVAAKLSGWDGVFMDDCNYTARYHASPASIVKYPTDAAYSAAMKGCIVAVVQALRAGGKKVYANLQLAEFPTASKDWIGAASLDGAMDEVWGRYATSNLSAGFSDAVRRATQVDNARWMIAQGKDLLAVCPTNGDTAIAAYGFGLAAAAAAGATGFGRVLYEAHGSDIEQWPSLFDAVA